MLFPQCLSNKPVAGEPESRRTPVQGLTDSEIGAFMCGTPTAACCVIAIAHGLFVCRLPGRNFKIRTGDFEVRFADLRSLTGVFAFNHEASMHAVPEVRRFRSFGLFGMQGFLGFHDNLQTCLKHSAGPAGACPLERDIRRGL